MEQAQRILETKSIDILLTDLEMPREHGLTLLAWLKDTPYHPVCLVLTGHQRFDYAREALHLSCFSYLLKPIDKLQLTSELSRAIASLTPAVSCQNNWQAPSEKSDSFVSVIQEYIYNHVDSSDLCRSSIAEYMHTNPEYLSCVFQQKFGQTLSTYIRQLRIDKAKELLLYTKLPLDEIAEKTGFSDSSYFQKQFKKSTGITPKQFRSLHAKNIENTSM